MLRGSLATAVCLLAVAIAPAAPGDLDPTFGSNGVVVSFFGTNAVPSSVAVDRDGKILVGGFLETEESGGFDSAPAAVVRYNADGTLDPSFGNGGLANTREFTPAGLGRGSGGPYNTGLRVEFNGWVVLGTVCQQFPGGGANVGAVFRLKTDGNPDPSFDGDGYVVQPLGHGPERFGGVVRSGSDVLMLAMSNGMAVTRFQGDGALATNFGAGGVAMALPWGTNSLLPTACLPYALVLQSEGRVVAVGSGQLPETASLVRLLPGGGIDTAFGLAGQVTVSIGTNCSARGAVVQADDKIVTAGTVSFGADSDILVMRIHPDGTPDAGFGSNGVVISAASPANDIAQAVALQADGKIIVAGSTGSPSRDFLLLRYLTNGAPDASFGSNGVVTTQITTGNDGAGALAIQPDGGIVAVGYANYGPSNLFALARYESGLGPEPEIAVAGPSVGALTHTQSVIDFGSLAPGESRGNSFVIKNIGYTNLTGLAITIDGTNAADFATTQPVLTELAPLREVVQVQISFTAGPTGHRTATLRIASSDLDENPFEVTLVGRSLSAIEQWRLAHFGSPDDAGVAADAHDCDPDGAPNLLEFATDSNPHVYGPVPATLAPDGASLTFTYSRNKDALAELSLIVEWSDSLLPDDWHADGTAESILSDDGHTQRVQVTLPAGPGPARFVRLRVTRP